MMGEVNVLDLIIAHTIVKKEKESKLKDMKVTLVVNNRPVYNVYVD